MYLFIFFTQKSTRSIDEYVNRKFTRVKKKDSFSPAGTKPNPLCNLKIEKWELFVGYLATKVDFL